MCVLTFIPIENKGFILTSNRDEAVSRKLAIPPQKYYVNGHQVFFPKDPQGNGTWIGSDSNFTLCLLNGGLEKHISRPPYRQSRGKVILDFYKYLNVQNFFNEYDFSDIEPFTLVILEASEGLNLYEIRWTGGDKILKNIAADKPQIWSSVTLYSPEIIRQREKWFSDFIQQNPVVSSENILNFHHFGGEGDSHHTIKMNRENLLKTISITQLQINEEQFLIRYEDLSINKTYYCRVFKECV
jgi:hypothetical protein